MVPAFFTVVPGRGGVARRAGPARRSRHGVAMGPALRPGSGTAPALEAQTDERQLAGGRDLHPGQGQLALPVSCGGFFRRDPRLSPLGQAGRGRSKALSGQSAGRQTIRRRESSTPTSMPLTRRRLCNSKTRVFWRRTANIDRCSTSITSWNRITGPSSGGSTRVSIFARFGEPGVRSPAMKRFI